MTHRQRTPYLHETFGHMPFWEPADPLWHAVQTSPPFLVNGGGFLEWSRDCFFSVKTTVENVFGGLIRRNEVPVGILFNGRRGSSVGYDYIGRRIRPPLLNDAAGTL